jgi:hypothetical protein
LYRLAKAQGKRSEVRHIGISDILTGLLLPILALPQLQKATDCVIAFFGGATLVTHDFRHSASNGFGLVNFPERIPPLDYKTDINRVSFFSRALIVLLIIWFKTSDRIRLNRSERAENDQAQVGLRR